jgi:murein DD-endopeptidase MepM/ murein hydrolase activator NlpD
MNRKWFVRIVAILLAVLMVCSVVYGLVNSVSASAVTQGQIDDLKKEAEDLEQKKQEIQSKINSLEYEQSGVIAKKAVLDEQIEYTQQEIINITNQIATYADLIEVKKLEVVEAQEREDAQWEQYKIRIRGMEENGTISYMAVIFDADSFVDLLGRIDLVSAIMEEDERLYQELKQSKLATIEAKESLEQAKLDEEAEKVALEDKQAELSVQQEEAAALIDEIEKNIEQSQALYEELNADANAIQDEINAKMEQLKREEEAKLAAGDSVIVGTGSFIWPAPSSKKVTSLFGTRLHPIYNTYRYHAGIDIGAKRGTNCIAADTGTVITAKYSSSYGNYIVISHGNGVTTLYAHLDSILVNNGDVVTQGDVIGKIGSTGASTGPHLHFEISVNGSRVNPLDYFSGYTIDE